MMCNDQETTFTFPVDKYQKGRDIDALEQYINWSYTFMVLALKITKMRIYKW